MIAFFVGASALIGVLAGIDSESVMVGVLVALALTPFAFLATAFLYQRTSPITVTSDEIIVPKFPRTKTIRADDIDYIGLEQGTGYVPVAIRDEKRVVRIDQLTSPSGDKAAAGAERVAEILGVPGPPDE